MHLHTIITTVFFLSSIHRFPYNHCVGAFVIRDCNVVRLQRQVYETTVCRSGRNVGNNSHINSRIKTLSLGKPILFDSVITDHEKIQDLTQEKVDSSLDSILTSTVTNYTTKTASETTYNDSRIEVVRPKNDKAVVLLTNVTTTTSMHKITALKSDVKKILLEGENDSAIKEKNDTDVAKPTVNGGYSHTKSSRAKISAANKGKIPWNKGKPRSEEVKSRIAAGVRAKNRERFLKKVEDMGLTEEEYEAQKREIRRIKETERRARRTSNGGYRPTEETKRKISKILKEKHAKGEVKPRSQIDPSKIRKGFTHSEETRKKISESLRKRWQNDAEFRIKMKESYVSRQDVRQRISSSLKKKWQDPEFRSGMMKKMTERKSGKDAMDNSKNHRKKISDAMKRKWQDASYREKTLSSIQKAAKNRKTTTSTENQKNQKAKTARRSKSKKETSKLQVNGTGNLQMIQPLSATDITKRKTKKAPRKRATNARIIAEDEKDVTAVIPVRKLKSNSMKLKGSGTVTSSTRTIRQSNEDTVPIEKERKKKKKKEKDGSVNRLREERRDLFDLLYGDEDGTNDYIEGEEGNILSQSSSPRVGMLLGDEDLDSFNPYGLADY